MVRRKAKEFSGADRRRLLFSDPDKPFQQEQHLASLVPQVVEQNMSNNLRVPEQQHKHYHFDIPLQSLEHPADSTTVHHHFSRSPNLPHAKIHAEVHEEEGIMEELADFTDDTSARCKRLTAYSRGNRSPVASYDNI